jgi:hypothetical protein
MTISFAAIFSLVVQERVGARIGSFLLWPMLAMGVASLLTWLWTDDLRLYFCAQFFPVLGAILSGRGVDGAVRTLSGKIHARTLLAHCRRPLRLG